MYLSPHSRHGIFITILILPLKMVRLSQQHANHSIQRSLRFPPSNFRSSLVSHSEEIWGQHFQLGVWSAFLSINKISLIYIICTLGHLFLGCIRCFFLNRTQASRKQFSFLVFIYGDIFLGAHNVWTPPLSVWMQPFSLNHKLLMCPLSLEPHPSNFYILSAPCLCVFVFMFVKNQLNQSEDKIYCHNLLITLLTCPMHFIFLTC